MQLSVAIYHNTGNPSITNAPKRVSAARPKLPGRKISGNATTGAIVVGSNRK